MPPRRDKSGSAAAAKKTKGGTAPSKSSGKRSMAAAPKSVEFIVDSDTDAVSDPSSEPEGKVATRSKTALNKKGSTTKGEKSIRPPLLPNLPLPPVQKKGKPNPLFPVAVDSSSYSTPPSSMTTQNPPATPKRTSKRKLTALSSKSLEELTPAPSPSPTKCLRHLAIRDDDDEQEEEVGPTPSRKRAPLLVEDDDEAEESEGDSEEDDDDNDDKGEIVEESDGDDDRGKMKKPHVKEAAARKSDDEDDPFADVGDVKSAKHNLKDSRNIFCKTLPKVDGVPKDVRDVVLGSFRLGGREQTNLLTSYAPWSGIGNTVGVPTEAYNNILDALTMKESGVFYTAGSADPRNFVARFIPSKRLNQQYELVSSTTGVMLQMAHIIGSLRSFRTREFINALCLSIASTLVLPASKVSRVRNIVSFQTRARSDDDKDDQDVGDSDMEVYESPSKSKAKAKAKDPSRLPSRHLKSPYKFNEDVPILDGRDVKLDFSAAGLVSHLDSLPSLDDDALSLKSPCVIGYNTYGYVYNGEWRVKFNVLFIIVIHIV
ncbi:hypothetical protein FA13DRAFT_1797387 [Coprinellus micaceus]|uniref:Uncharacterized protein n=1 Tax=Coprinellus micaceus TaxID=71717 RepID=A0A4Y7SQP1_COPMI|nr:hypothetical protein FA13DRAFT_1797387 [Coprinellus micaceus]